MEKLRGLLVIHVSMHEHEAAWRTPKKLRMGQGERILARKGRTENFLEAELSSYCEEGTVGREFR